MSITSYLQSSEFIDWENPDIAKLALELKGQDEEETAKNCFEYVRDEIKHSYDYKLNPVTCKASDVLHYKHGYCYAKSHLLAALLRANNIPAGLCYQRLKMENDKFCLHGLNAVYLKQHGWYKIDARGNNKTVQTEFKPPYEYLAYKSNTEIGEMDLPEIYSEPLKIVTDVLTSSSNCLEVYNNLPDIQTI